MGKGNVPVRIDTVVISVQHEEEFTMKALREFVREEVITPVLNEYGFSVEDVVNIFINPTGNFVIGGPHGDSGPYR